MIVLPINLGSEFVEIVIPPPDPLEEVPEALFVIRLFIIFALQFVMYKAPAVELA